ncbi:MAG: sigma factor-like helix-turn-helix DNA-binding protein [Planctomycetota bacterium]
MKDSKTGDEWPPKSGKIYLESDRFFDMLFEVSERLSSLNPTLDFSDAVSVIFMSLRKRLKSEPDFFRLSRFPTEYALRRYLWASVLNVGREAKRQSKRSRESSYSGDARDPGYLAEEGSLPSMEELEVLEQLPGDMGRVIWLHVFEEQSFRSIAREMGCSFSKVKRLYDEGVKRLAVLMGETEGPWSD